jgi:DNA-directed RNA polymerase subunit omega
MDLPHNIDSKFRLILLIAARARQLQAGARPLIQTQSTKVTKVAHQEVDAGLVPFENVELNPDHNDKNRKPKPAK